MSDRVSTVIRRSGSGSWRRCPSSTTSDRSSGPSHERWDGKGYPDRLAGDRIPVEARIVFVCDAFHAMTTDRPYRVRPSEKDAIRRLNGHSQDGQPAVAGV